VLVVRALSNTGVILSRQAGLQRLKHASLAVVAGAMLGFAFDALQGPPSRST